MGAVSKIDEILRLNAERIFWWEPTRQLSFADLRRDLQEFRQKTRQGIWVSYEKDSYRQFIYALAAMCDGWVLAPLSHRYTWEQLAPWREQIPFMGVLSSDTNALATDIEAHHVVLEGDGSCLLIFSSGSTGKPKAIAHSADSLMTSAQASLDFYNIRPGESWLLSLDVSHIGGFQIILRCFLGGVCCVSGFAPNEIGEALEAFPELSYMSLVPTQFQRLIQARPEVPKSLRAVLLGGAATPWALVQKAKELAWPVSLTYGSTETASQVSAFQAGAFPGEPGEVGDIFPIWEAEIHQEKLFLKGLSSCLGWWQAKVFYPVENQTLCQPDKARVRGRRLILEGRRDDVFQVAGINLAPREILEPLASLSKGGDWLLLAQAHEEYGQVPVLIFRGMDPPPELSIVEEVLQKTLPRIKWPYACYWHRTADLLKPSLAYYRHMIETGKLETMWTRT